MLFAYKTPKISPIYSKIAQKLKYLKKCRICPNLNILHRFQETAKNVFVLIAVSKISMTQKASAKSSLKFRSTTETVKPSLIKVC